MSTPLWNRYKAGEMPTADEWNNLVDTVELLWNTFAPGMDMVRTGAGVALLPPRVPRFRIVELNENVDAYESNKNANVVQWDGSAISDIGQDADFITDVQGGFALAGERHVAFSHLGVQALMPFTQWHLAVLDGALSVGGNAAASVWQVTSSAEEDSTETLTVYDWVGQALPSGTKIIALQHRQSRWWYALPIGSASGVYEGELSTAMTAATHPKSGATTCSMLTYSYDSGNLVDGDTITVTNRSVDLSASAGTYLIVKLMPNGEWRPIWVDCNPFAESSA